MSKFTTDRGPRQLDIVICAKSTPSHMSRWDISKPNFNVASPFLYSDIFISTSTNGQGKGKGGSFSSW